MIGLLFKAAFDSTAYDAGMRRIEGATKKASSNIAASFKSQVGAAIGVGALTIAGKQAIDYGSKVEDLSARLGVSRTAIQEWDFALGQSGGTMEDAAKFTQKLTQTRADALAGNDKLVASFRELGVSLDDLRSKRIEDLFSQIAGSMKGADPQRFMDAFLDVGGKGAGDMMAAFVNGFDDAIARARELGVVLDDVLIKRLDAAGDKLDEAKRKLRVPTAEGVAMVAGFIGGAVESISDFGKILGAASAGGFRKDVVSQIQEEYDRPGNVVSPEQRAAGKAAAAAKKEAQELAEFREEMGAFLDEDEKTAERVLKLREQIIDAERSRLPLEQKRAAIADDLLAAEKKVAELRANRPAGVTTDNEDILRAELDRVKLANELAGLADKDKGAFNRPDTFSALDKIGLHGLGGPSPQLELTRQQLKELQAITRNTDPAAAPKLIL